MFPVGRLRTFDGVKDSGIILRKIASLVKSTKIKLFEDYSEDGIVASLNEHLPYACDILEAALSTDTRRQEDCCNMANPSMNRSIKTIFDCLLVVLFWFDPRSDKLYNERMMTSEQFRKYFDENKFERKMFEKRAKKSDTLINLLSFYNVLTIYLSINPKTNRNIDRAILVSELIAEGRIYIPGGSESTCAIRRRQVFDKVSKDCFDAAAEVISDNLNVSPCDISTLDDIWLNLYFESSGDDLLNSELCEETDDDHDEETKPAAKRRRLEDENGTGRP